MTSRRRQYSIYFPPVLLAVALIFCCTSLSFAATFYISPDASTAGDGSREKPWTVNIALSQGGGNTYIFLPGIYRGPIQLNKFHAGREDNPTILRSEVKWKAQIMGSSSYLMNISWDAPHIIIDGFDVSGGTEEGVASSSDYTTIRNCWIHNNGTMGISIHKRKHAIIENNLIEYNGMHPQFHHGIYLDGEDHVIRGNIVRHNSGYGIHLYPAISNSVLENNLVYGHYNHAGIIMVSPGDSKNLKVINNTIANNLVGLEIWGSKGTIIQNNIFSGNQKAFLFLNVIAPQIDYNLYDMQSDIHGPNDFKGFPEFVNSKFGIYWIGQKSDARGRGNPNIIPETDLWGRSRPKNVAPDLGAYQYLELTLSEKDVKKWQYGSRFDTPEPGDLPDLWLSPAK